LFAILEVPSNISSFGKTLTPSLVGYIQFFPHAFFSFFSRISL
jgi:hypothetical protein